jgi:hypothetical protein
VILGKAQTVTDINVFKLSAKLVLLLYNYAYSLLVVTLNNRRVVELQGQSFKQAALLLYF